MIFRLQILIYATIFSFLGCAQSTINKINIEQLEKNIIEWKAEKGGNGHSYVAMFVPNGITWDKADSTATALGGYLATITSSKENEFIYCLIKDNNNFWFFDTHANGMGPWLGGYQKPNSNEPKEGWHWITNEAFIYTNWSTYEPNNASAEAGNENRIHFFGYNTLKSSFWNDYSNTRESHGYIVEFDNISK